MAEQKFFADDRGIIPEYIKKMSSEERKAEIARLEKELRDKKAEKAREVS